MLKKLSKIIIIMVCLCMTLGKPLHVEANVEETKAVDIVNKAVAKTFSYTRNPVSVDVGKLTDIPNTYRNVLFKVKLSSGMQYNRVTGKYVSASTPTITLQYVGPVPLQLNNISTNKKDNGNSVTFSYSADVTANVDTGFLWVKISYGRISGSYTVNK